MTGLWWRLLWGLAAVGVLEPARRGRHRRRGGEPVAMWLDYDESTWSL